MQDCRLAPYNLTKVKKVQMQQIQDTTGFVNGWALTSSGLLLCLAGILLDHIGCLQQGPVCGCALLLPPPQLVGMHLVSVTPQVMAYKHHATMVYT